MEVRFARPEDREAIFELYRFAYSDWNQRIPDRWLWQFVDNPYADPQRPSIILALDDEGRIIGQTASVTEPIRIHSQNYLSGWVVDVYVRPEYRGQGVAKALKKMQKSQKDMIEMSISMVDAMRHIVQNLGSIPWAPVEVYLLRVNPFSISDSLARRIGGGFLGFLLSKVRLGVLYGQALNHRLDRKAQARRSQGRDLTFREIQEWGADADRLWADLEQEIPHGIIRNARYLNWKYLAQPGVSYQSFMAYRNEEPVGYLILRTLTQSGVVVDLLFSPRDRIGILAALDFAVSYFQNKGLTEVRAGASHPMLVSCFKEAGYHKPVRSMTPLFYTTREMDLERLAQEPCWFTLGDHDIQQ